MKFFLSAVSVCAVTLMIVGCGAALPTDAQVRAIKTNTSKSRSENTQTQENNNPNRHSEDVAVRSAKSAQQSEANNPKLAIIDPIAAAKSLPAPEKTSAVPMVKTDVTMAAVTTPPIIMSAAQTTEAQQQFSNPQQSALELQSIEFKQRITFVDLTYKICLGRAPEGSGLIYWSNLIASKQASFDQVKSEICSSPEAQIVKVYRDLLGRVPDSAGLNYWYTAFVSGRLTIEQIRQSIASSDERKAIDLQQKIIALKADLSALEKERSDVVARLTKI